MTRICLLVPLLALCGTPCFAQNDANTPKAAAPAAPAKDPSKFEWTAKPALDRADAAIAAIVAVPADKRTFDNTLGALDDMIARLEDDSNMLLFLKNVSTSAEEREKSEKAEQEVEKWRIDLGKREDLYNAVKQYADTKPKLEGEQKRMLEFTMRDYHRAGMDLSKDKRDELTKIEKKVIELGQLFEQRIRDDKSVVLADASELKGMTPDYIAALKRGDDQSVPEEIRKQIAPADKDKYVLRMDYPTFYPLMDFCENDGLRERTWKTFKCRGGKDNIKTLEEIIKLRADAAKMLGYATTADYETEPRMAKNAATVKAFYDKLRPIVRRKSQLDWDELLQAKVATTGNKDAQFYPWDQSFYKNKLMKEKYAADTKKIQEYFPLQHVIDGLFQTTQSLYGLEYREVTAEAAQKYGTPLWHPDVKVYDVYDTATRKYLGAFYLDLYPRDNKFGHAAQWGIRQHKVYTDGRLQTPLAALVCNFTKPTADKPSLLTHEEVLTFFHEFGHCLHTILSECRYNEFSGTNVSRDFVEAPSQMFENWTWNADVLNTFAQHYKTGEKLPKDLLEGMIRARNVSSGLEAEHQIFYGMTDMAFHTVPDGVVDTTVTQEKLFGEVELYKPVKGTYYQASFGHLVGYQAGYYGYMWSLVYAQDMFSRFRDLGITSPKAGQYYRQKILSRGGTLDEIDLVRDYLGREPNMDAFLEHLGLKQEVK